MATCNSTPNNEFQTQVFSDLIFTTTLSASVLLGKLPGGASKSTFNSTFLWKLKKENGAALQVKMGLHFPKTLVCIVLHESVSTNITIVKD